MGQPDVMQGTSTLPRAVALAGIAAALLLSGCSATPEQQLRELFSSTATGRLELPSGEILISTELTLALGAHDVEIVGDQTIIKAADNFTGRALLAIENVSGVTIRNVIFDGNREALNRPFPIAPPENAFRIWYPLNGLLADQVTGFEVADTAFRNVVHFPILVSRSSAIRIHDITVEDSGGLNQTGRNNLSGGILIEEGSENFEVRNSTFRNIRGNGLWTHSLFTSPRLADGVFAGNHFDTVGRDALQVGHATRVMVADNTGVNIGYPVEIVDIENDGIPVGVDTAGDVDQSTYANNVFEEINGKCFDLDGFHDGTVRDNTCTNRGAASDYPTGHFGIVMNNTNPATHSSNIRITGNTIDGAKYGGVFVMGADNHVTGNRFLNLNLAHCEANTTEAACLYMPSEPELLRAGIYLGKGVARLEQTVKNTIRGNEITGYAMSKYCIAAGPGVDLISNSISANNCRDANPGHE